MTYDIESSLIDFVDLVDLSTMISAWDLVWLKILNLVLIGRQPNLLGEFELFHFILFFLHFVQGPFMS